MKKVILNFTVLSILVAFSLSIAGSAANSHSVGGNSNWGPPDNITVYTLDSANYKTDDTIGATYSNYYGPYAISAGPGRPIFKGLRAFATAGSLNATCTLSVEYQIVPTKLLKDTSQVGWTSFDSIKAAAGNARTYVDISSKPGAAIAFKMHCLSNSSTAVIAKPIKIVMMGTSTESVDTKH